MRAFILALIATGTAAQAQNVEFNFTAGLGAQSAPLFFGADETVTGVTGSFKFGDFSYKGRCFGCGKDPDGFGVTGSFRYIGARDGIFERFEDDGIAVESPYTYDAVDAAIELGGGLSYDSAEVEAFAVVRRGFGGHDGFVFDLGGDYVMRPSDALTLRAGPRLLAGDDTFLQTYFSTGQGIFPGQGSFEASGGLVSRGVELSATYDVSDQWGVTAKARYEQLLKDAAASPLTESTDQTTISLVLTHNFSWSF